MEDMLVARVMSTDLHTVTPETLVEDAAAEILEHDISSLLVVDDDNQLEGILTTTDFVRVVAKSHPKAETSVSQYMTSDVVTTTARASIRTVADTMIERGFHHVPVVDETEGLIGILSTTDLATYLSNVQTPSPS